MDHLNITFPNLHLPSSTMASPTSTPSSPSLTGCSNTMVHHMATPPLLPPSPPLSSCPIPSSPDSVSSIPAVNPFARSFRSAATTTTSSSIEIPSITTTCGKGWDAMTRQKMFEERKQMLQRMKQAKVTPSSSSTPSSSTSSTVMTGDEDIPFRRYSSSDVPSERNSASCLASLDETRRLSLDDRKLYAEIGSNLRRISHDFEHRMSLRAPKGRRSLSISIFSRAD